MTIRRGRRRKQLLDDLRKRDGVGNRKSKHLTALCGELVLEKAMDLLSDRLRNDEYVHIYMKCASWYKFVEILNTSARRRAVTSISISTALWESIQLCVNYIPSNKYQEITQFPGTYKGRISRAAKKFLDHPINQQSLADTERLIFVYPPQNLVGLRLERLVFSRRISKCVLKTLDDACNGFTLTQDS